MKRLGVREIAVSAIEVPHRLRNVDQAWAEALAVSIRENGLQQPIQVLMPQGNDLRPANERMDGPFQLIAGLHRLTATRLLGEAEILAVVFWGSDDEARLQEIDENLIRRELNPLHRARFLAERKALYERLHPETRHGAQGGRGGRKNENSTMPFSKETAERIGLSVSTIERAVALWSALHPVAREMLADLPIAATAAELKALAALDQALQKIIVNQLASGQHKSVRDAIAGGERKATTKPSPDAKLQGAWQRSGRKGRVAFMRWLVEIGVVESYHEDKVR